MPMALSSERSTPVACRSLTLTIPQLGPVSSNAWADDWQGFASPTAGANNTWAVVDLGAPAANIETMYFWNVQEGITAPGNGEWARGK